LRRSLPRGCFAGAASVCGSAAGVAEGFCVLAGAELGAWLGD
jgi:hypothetical protein